MNSTTFPNYRKTWHHITILIYISLFSSNHQRSQLGTFSWRKKNCCSFGICPNKGEEDPAQFLLSHFQGVHFWSIKDSISSKMPVIWTLKCFFRLYIYSISYSTYSIFSPKLSFKSWISTLEKSCTSCPNWREWGWGNLDKIQKKNSFFSGEGPLEVWLPIYSVAQHKSSKGRVWRQFNRCAVFTCLTSPNPPVLPSTGRCASSCCRPAAGRTSRSPPARSLSCCARPQPS